MRTYLHLYVSCFFFWGRVSYSLDCFWTHYVTKNGLGVLIFLSLLLAGQGSQACGNVPSYWLLSHQSNHITCQTQLQEERIILTHISRGVQCLVTETVCQQKPGTEIAHIRVDKEQTIWQELGNRYDLCRIGFTLPVLPVRHHFLMVPQPQCHQLRTNGQNMSQEIHLDLSYNTLYFIWIYCSHCVCFQVSIYIIMGQEAERDLLWHSNFFFCPFLAWILSLGNATTYTFPIS